MIKLGWRIWFLIIVLLLSLLAIRPSFQEGVVVESVDRDSLIFDEGLRVGEIIKSVNGKEVKNVESYAKVVEETFVDGEEKRIDVVTKTGDYTILSDETLQITVSNLPRSKIQTGLDLRGGARALVQPDEEINDQQLKDLIEVSRNRFNVYGLSDVNLRGVTDLAGNKFMLIEIAGASPDELEQLVSQQGKFEAKIANETVFIGGERDISDVCRNDASCASVTGCFPDGNGGQFCNFAFTIFLTADAAKKHAQVTGELDLDETGQYLSESLILYVDDIEADSLLIGSSLKGQVTTQISIQGSGQGETEQDAFDDAQAEMNRLQTVLITGSLPYKLNIEKLDTISPVLGGEFVYYILMAGIAAIVLVSLLVLMRYRKFKASLALLFTAFSEFIIILGVAALIGWNLDLPSIAGILATVGTGVDQQIVILDEASRRKNIGISQRMKRALFVIIAAYLTSVVALLPLYWAGAGLFRGFAFTTIIGITAGVLITRPAFAEMIKKIEA
tara:strand:+ start:3254 stop:4762 length:1509 start_codon:yes stop_codon:yes gene_type:complete